MVEGLNPDLEQFRKQWQEEVTARNRGSVSNNQDASNSKPGLVRASSRYTERRLHKPVLPDADHHDEVREDHSSSFNFDDLDEREEARRLGVDGGNLHPESYRSKEPVSALEHYERAVEKETQGRLGESLAHYRKAYKVILLFHENERSRSTNIYSLTTASIRHTRTYTSLRHFSRIRNLRARTKLQQLETLPIIPSMGPQP